MPKSTDWTRTFVPTKQVFLNGRAIGYWYTVNGEVRYVRQCKRTPYAQSEPTEWGDFKYDFSPATSNVHCAGQVEASWVRGGMAGQPEQ